MRPSRRKNDQLREISIETDIKSYAEGVCLVSFGNTRVLCTATVEDKTPPFLRDTGKGWVTAEYSMLPRATHQRVQREASKGRQSGRTMEIQRLIGRSLRAVTDLKALGERQIIVDCDVINADGGTRTASITGGYVALYQALKKLNENRVINKIPLTDNVAAISCGIYKGEVVIDLDYEEDSSAQADANFVLTGSGGIIEVQGTAEDKPFSEEQFLQLLKLAKQGVGELVKIQNLALGK